MLHRAIGMAESLGLVNNTKKVNLEAAHFSKDMRRSLKRTAWGLFQIDTCVHRSSNESEESELTWLQDCPHEFPSTKPHQEREPRSHFP